MVYCTETKGTLFDLTLNLPRLKVFTCMAHETVFGPFSLPRVSNIAVSLRACFLSRWCWQR